MAPVTVRPRNRRFSDLLEAAYPELRRLAADYLRRERVGHTLQPTALVHEAYVSLALQPNLRWRNRPQVLAMVARTMRCILVDYARSHRAQKRGGGLPKLTLSGLIAPTRPVDVDILDLHDALTRFAELDATSARLVELRFFAGLSIPEIAGVLEMSPATVKRRWSLARAWLYNELVGVEDGTGPLAESR